MKTLRPAFQTNIAVHDYRALILRIGGEKDGQK